MTKPRDFASVLAFALILSALPNSSAVNVTVSVYYESLCSDSMLFFTQQLNPTFNLISSNIQADLVPYGKATTEVKDGNYNFECQHGSQECIGNIYHACTLSLVKESKEQVKSTTCLMKIRRPYDWPATTKHCLGGQADEVINCAQSDKGKQLLNEYGLKTNSYANPISYVPTVLLDGKRSGLAESNLLKAVCKKLEEKSETPNQCKNF